jgi:hypothetical protein
MKFFFTAIAAGTLLLQVSCDQSSESKVVKDVQLEEMNKMEEFSGESGDHFMQDTLTASSGNGQQAPPVPKQKSYAPADWNKKIIKNGQLNLEVKDYKAFSKKLREKVTAAGGYVASEEQHNSDYKIEEVMTIRVPVVQFDEAVDLISADAEKIIEKTISTDDVTSTIIDVKSRMEAKKNVRQRYMDLLKQANKMTDILQVEKEINSIQEEIEAATGRIDYLSNASAYSTIRLTFFQVLNAAEQPDAPLSFLAKTRDAFKTGAGWAGDLFIALVSIWPLWLGLFLIYMVVRKLKPSKIKSA